MKEIVTRRHFLAAASTAALAATATTDLAAETGGDKWKLLDKTWELIENPIRFDEYVESETAKLLAERD